MKLLQEVTFFIIGFIAFYFLMWLFIGLPILFFKSVRSQKNAYRLIFVTSLIAAVVASFNFYSDIAINTIEINSDKVSRDYQFLHITDTQFGSLSRSDIKKVGDTVNKVLETEEIDAIFFTGDLIDTDYYSREDIEPLNFNHPAKYFSYGNHEFYHDPERLRSIISEFNYQILRNESFAFNEEIEVIGIDDSSDENFVKENLDKIALNNDKFNVLLYHRPAGIEDAQKAGINLMVVGHTHGRQIFPYTILYGLFTSEFKIGETTIGDFTLYHSTGAGLWGPKMRLGTENEITIINVNSAQ
jgi:predicted MPP superfamily phosphohydrolase